MPTVEPYLKHDKKFFSHSYNKFLIEYSIAAIKSTNVEYPIKIFIMLYENCLI